MATNNRTNNPDLPNVYTVYQGGGGQYNYGFHPNHPQAPPPKYEDVMSGRPGEQHQHPHLPPPPLLSGPHQHEVILVTPQYNYSRTQKIFGSLFTIIFFIAFITIFTKIMSNH